MTRNVPDPRTGSERDTGRDGGATVDIIGKKWLELTRDDLGALPTVERECSVVCASGDRTVATWTGVPVRDLLAIAGAPPSTTHLHLSSADNYHVCVRIAAAFDALVAVTRDGADLANGNCGTRFVGTQIDGKQSIKAVARIEPVSIEPGNDPAEQVMRPVTDRENG